MNLIGLFSIFRGKNMKNNTIKYIQLNKSLPEIIQDIFFGFLFCPLTILVLNLFVLAFAFWYIIFKLIPAIILLL